MPEKALEYQRVCLGVPQFGTGIFILPGQTAPDHCYWQDRRHGSAPLLGAVAFVFSKATTVLEPQKIQPLSEFRIYA
jgi:hypothetical protein